MDNQVMGLMMAPARHSEGKATPKAKPLTLQLSDDTKSMLVKVSNLLSEKENRNVTVQEVLRRLAETGLTENGIEQLADKLTGK